jgi:hypothetical protein
MCSLCLYSFFASLHDHSLNVSWEAHLVKSVTLEWLSLKLLMPVAASLAGMSQHWRPLSTSPSGCPSRRLLSQTWWVESSNSCNWVLVRSTWPVKVVSVGEPDFLTTFLGKKCYSTILCVGSAFHALVQHLWRCRLNLYGLNSKDSHKIEWN